MAKKEKSGVDKVVKKVNKLIDEIEKLRGREMKRFNDELERRLNDLHEMQQTIMDRVGLGGSDKANDKATTKKTAKSSGKTGASKAASAPKSNKSSKAPKKSANSKQTGATKTAKSAGKTTAKSTTKSAQSTSSAKKALTQKAATTAKKTQTRRPPTPKPLDKNDLTRIKGVGPATAEKMRAIGITSIDQIATPNESDQQKLQEFAKMRGFQTWQVEAKKLLP